ncbi:MAG: hypothetical protein ABIQ95_00700 [Bdellovibrionia bacterium]
MNKFAGNENPFKVTNLISFMALLFILSLSFESQANAKTHIYSSLNKYPATINAVDETLNKTLPTGIKGETAITEYVNSTFSAQARKDKLAETWITTALEDYKKERKLEQDKKIAKATAVKERKVPRIIGPDLSVNEHNVVKDNRLRVLGVANNYCMHNGILMVGTQVSDNCSFSASSLQLPSVAPTPRNYIATPEPSKEAPVSPMIPQHVAFNDEALNVQIGLLNSLGQGMTAVAPVADTGPVMALADGSAATGYNMDTSSPDKKSLGAILGDFFGGDKGNNSGGAASGSPGSGGTGFDSMDTPSPTKTAGAGPRDSSAALGVMYQGGGRGGKGAGGSKNSGMRGLSAGTGGSALNFDSAGSGGPNPILGDDPEDYFTRINLDDSIFKIIRKRYQTKEKNFLDL